MSKKTKTDNESFVKDDEMPNIAKTKFRGYAKWGDDIYGIKIFQSCVGDLVHLGDHVYILLKLNKSQYETPLRDFLIEVNAERVEIYTEEREGDVHTAEIQQRF